MDFFIYSGSILSKLKAGLWFFFFENHLMVLCICTNFHEEIFRSFQDVEGHEILSFELVALSAISPLSELLKHDFYFCI